jgi:hypothetical protein
VTKRYKYLLAGFNVAMSMGWVLALWEWALKLQTQSELSGYVRFAARADAESNCLRSNVFFLELTDNALSQAAYKTNTHGMTIRYYPHYSERDDLFVREYNAKVREMVSRTRLSSTNK